MPPTYLDCNATTPLCARVLTKMTPYLTGLFGNASSRDHAFGWDAAEAVEEARGLVADLVGAAPAEIIFTSGATEGVNAVIGGVGPARRDGTRRIVTQATEHLSVLEACRRAGARDGILVDCLPVRRDGHLDLDRVADAAPAGQTLLVALMAANNEIGTIHPIGAAAAVAHRAGALFFTDAAQAVGKVPVDLRADGVDLAAFSAHKFYGPKGVGALFVRGGEPRIELEPLIVGGGQERGRRGGTLNVPGIVGFGEACRIAKAQLREDGARMRRLRDRLEIALLAALPDIRINGDSADRLPNTSNITFSGIDARTLIRDMHDVAVSTRSACSSGPMGPSHVLKAIGLTDEQAYASVRFSLGRFTTDEDLDYAIDRVTTSVRKLRK